MRLPKGDCSVMHGISTDTQICTANTTFKKQVGPQLKQAGLCVRWNSRVNISMETVFKVKRGAKTARCLLRERWGYACVDFTNALRCMIQLRVMHLKKYNKVQCDVYWLFALSSASFCSSRSQNQGVVQVGGTSWGHLVLWVSPRMETSQLVPVLDDLHSK